MESGATQRDESLVAGGPSARPRRFPEAGALADKVLFDLDELRARDVKWWEGRHQGAIYFAGGAAADVARRAYAKFFVENPVMTNYFPSMARIEHDLLAMASDLLQLRTPCGSITSGGSESNILAAIAARSRFRQLNGGRRPKIILPYSAHPSFRKAALYLDADVETIPLDAAFRADLGALERAIDDRTMLLVTSAPAYNTGMVDDIPSVGAIAEAHGLPLHVDACVGGFLLPFAQQLGRETAPFDFRVAGVTSMSADLHKHGFAPKGVSLVLFRSESDLEFVTFDFDDWPGGAYSTRTVVGSRSGGALAAAWAVLRTLGRDGYVEVTRQTLELSDRFRRDISSIPDLYVIGETQLNKFGYASETLDIYAVADLMEDRGWVVMRQQQPDAIHMHIQIYHSHSADQYLDDLSDVALQVREQRLVGRGKAAAYNV